jgi:hydroxylamine reductase
MERGCMYHGACGKNEETANLQDLLIYILRGIAFCAEPQLNNGHVDRETGLFLCRSLFSTITNTNFDPARFAAMIHDGIRLRNKLRDKGRLSLPADSPDSVTWEPGNKQTIEMKSLKIDIRDMKNLDQRSIRELAIYGMKGAAAYAVHAAALGAHDDSIFDFLVRALAAMNRPQTETELESIALETGRIMLNAMALLDEAHVKAFGKPALTQISLATRRSPGILVTGHDLKDLEELLQQTADKGIDVYTHSEMWSAHQYPYFKNFPHLAGNYGNAWWMQDLEFAAFNGPILVTSNCIIPVAPAYRDRIYTTGVAGYPGIPHIPEGAPGHPKDFSRLIIQAKSSLPPAPWEDGSVPGGFSHHAVAPILNKVVDAVLSGKIRRFVVMGGCDGRDQRRVYYSNLAQALPPDTVILSAGCAKYRFIKMDLGSIEGIPRILDAGQCNDCYSLVRIAQALQEATNAASINDLPIALDIAWYDQKAVGVVLALAALGVRGIRIGPTLPAFLQSDGGRRFMKKFDIFASSTVEEDLAAICRTN